MTAKQQQGIGEFGNPYLYKSYYYDIETGLYYLNARYYDPIIGRFLSKDPVPNDKKDRIGQNSYVYCNNNPLVADDPSGFKSMYWWWRHRLYQARLANRSKNKLYKGYNAAYYQGLANYLKKKYSKTSQWGVNRASYQRDANKKKAATAWKRHEYLKAVQYGAKAAYWSGQYNLAKGKKLAKNVGKAIKEKVRVGASATTSWLQGTIPGPAVDTTVRARGRVTIREKRDTPASYEPSLDDPLRTKLRSQPGSSELTISQERVKLAASLKDSPVSLTTSSFWDEKKLSFGVDTALVSVDYGKYHGEAKLETENVFTFNPKNPLHVASAIGTIGAVIYAGAAMVSGAGWKVVLDGAAALGL